MVKGNKAKVQFAVYLMAEDVALIDAIMEKHHLRTRSEALENILTQYKGLVTKFARQQEALKEVTKDG